MAKRQTVEAPPRFKHSGREKNMSKKQIRARARRAGKISKAEMDVLYKPLDEWDPEELARGRPRGSDGTFRGKPPPYVTRELYEEAISLFQENLRKGMRADTNTALAVITRLMTSEEVDERGKPIVPASVQLQAAQFLIEHAIGKPTQRVQGDISVKLQAILAAATAGPGQEGFALAELANPDIVDAEVIDDDD